ncbi:MAG TPA: DNA repair protein RecO [Candidatus Binatia bacterium]|nr:DNA repair protein RecO [Candidatus Binatia bacterium]
MRLHHTTLAIVLRSRPFGESDKIVSFLTEGFGKLAGIAKGALRSRKRFVNSLEPFALINLHFHDRPHSNLAFILGADLQRAFRKLTAGLDRIAYASYLTEITDGLIGDREENPAAFHHLKDGLAYLEENGPSLRFVTFFELKLLRLAGYQPTFDCCKGCRKSPGAEAGLRWHFSPADGGMLCEPCARRRREVLPLSQLAMEVLADLQNESSAPAVRLTLPASVVQEIRSVALRLVEYHVEREIKSAPFLHRFSWPASAPRESVQQTKQPFP